MRIRALFTTAAAALALAAVWSPAGAQTATATATLCKDGTSSGATNTAGVCVGHGGLATRTTSTVSKSVTCNDGSMRDAAAACKDHGGVKAVEHSTTTTTRKAAMANDDAADAIAVCKNGKYWHAGGRAGACARNGGVDHFIKQ